MGKLAGIEKSEKRKTCGENRENPRLKIARKKKLISLSSLFSSRHYPPIYLSLFPRLLSERTLPTCAERWEIARFNNAACLFRENNCSHRLPPSLSFSSFSTIIFLFFFFFFQLATSFSISTASDRPARETPVRSAFIRDFAFARITRDSGLRFSIGNDSRERTKKKKRRTHSRLAAF